MLESADKAYNNSEFIHGPDARVIRLLSEYLHPQQILEQENINRSIIFFGSARTKPMENGRKETEINKLNAEFYEGARELAKMLAEWSSKLAAEDKFYICSGGGPGIMEAANRGASEAGEKSIGLNISLPFEQQPNQYISPELNFEFHYFFMRKFWFIYKAKAMAVFPGGFGTLDELMELLTLRQTGKVTKELPIVLYSEEYWKNLINFDLLVKYGNINQEDLDLFEFKNTPEEAFDYISKELSKIYKLDI
jgi:uncharacterized protein (TIGR00730 family)